MFFFLALGLVLTVSSRWTLQVLACIICTPNRGEMVVQALAPEAGECNPQSTVQPPRITGPFFFFFHFSLQPLTDVLHDERDIDRDEISISLQYSTCIRSSSILRCNLVS